MHDRNGTPLKVGDGVMIPAIVHETHDADGFCNVTLKTVEPMFPTTNVSTVCLNAKQVVLMYKEGA